MAMSWAAAWACYRPAPFASSHRTAAGDAGGFHRPAHGCRRQLVPATPARRLGLFVALTGTQINARDALDLDLADRCLREDQQTELLDGTVQINWQEQADSQLHSLLRALGRQAAERLPDARLLPRRTRIDELLDVAELPHAWQALTALQSDPDELLAESAHALSTGCPLALILSGSNSGVPGNCR